jgi:hypothetical protein
MFNAKSVRPAKIYWQVCEENAMSDGMVSR